MEEWLFSRPAGPDDDPIYAALLEPQHADIRAHLQEMWSRYRSFATQHWWNEFSRAGKTHQRFWEMYLTVALQDAGLALTPQPDDAPDVLADLGDGSPAWFEAVAVDGGDPVKPNSVLAPPGAHPISTGHAAQP